MIGTEKPMGGTSIISGTVQPTLPHVVFYNLTNAGASAIVPILNEILSTHFQYTELGDPSNSSEFESYFEENTPMFHWTHSPSRVFERFLNRDDFRFICLFRDPRDVLVSHVKDIIHLDLHEGKTEKELYLEYIEANFDGMYHFADEWIHLNQPNVHTLSFEEMKRDIPATTRNILRHIGLSVPEEIITEACARHSFETITNRQCGEEGEISRNNLMFRKGISGDWKNQFDGQVRESFHLKFSEFIRRWGFGTVDAIDQQREAEFYLVSAPFPCGVAWLVNVLLELDLKTTHCGPDYKNSHWSLDDSGNHQIHPQAREHLRWHLPAIEQNAKFHFEPNIEIHWEHRLDFARHWHRPTILFTRDGRDAVYSHYRRHHAEVESFDNFLSVSSEWPDHSPDMFGLPTAETWGLFNLYWLEMSKVIPVHVVRFEDTKTDPVEVVKGVLNFLGVERPMREIQRAIEASTFEAAQQQEEKVANSSNQSTRGNHRRGQPYEWREHFTEQYLAAFSGIADEALRQLGYSSVKKSTVCPTQVNTQDQPFFSERVGEVRQAIQEGDLPKAGQLLLKRALKTPDEDTLLLTLAERKAIEWTHKIFNKELGRSCVADTARKLFTGILRDYSKSKPIRKVLTERLSLQLNDHADTYARHARSLVSIGA